MIWNNFLKSICSNQKYELTPSQQEVVMCIKEAGNQTKNDLFLDYNQRYFPINEEAFTQRLKNIYRNFKITETGHKLPQLHKYLVTQYLEYKNNNIFFSEIGLSHIYSEFPRDKFSQELDRIIKSKNQEEKQVDILQTFAPNLDHYRQELIRCLQHQVKVRILLAWPYSQAAKLREAVLTKYAQVDWENEINICNQVERNLESLEKIIQQVGQTNNLEIKLYDTLPSLAIYRAGNYLLAAPFLHSSLAIKTFQLELNLNTSNPLVTSTLQQDFELMWHIARYFDPNPQKNWRNDLKILFTN